MNYLHLDQLEAGKVYLFSRYFNSKRIVLQPAEFISGQRPRDSHNQALTAKVLVRFCLDGKEVEVRVGDGKRAAAVLTTAWLQRQLNDRADEVARIQTEASKLLDLYNLIK